MKIYIKSNIATSDIKSIRNNLFLYYGKLKDESYDFFDFLDKIADEEDQVDDILIEERAKLYKQYAPLADKCEEIIDTIRSDKTGHIIDDEIRRSMYTMAEDVVSNFPYDWEKWVDYVESFS